MNTISYNCKRCNRTGTAEYDPEGVNEIEKWKPMLTCNPCADYMSSIRKLKDEVYRLSGELNRSRMSRSENGIRMVREKFILVTKKIAYVVSRQYRVTNIWSEDFVDQIMERPDKSLIIVDTYEKMIQRRSKESEPLVEELV